jgi:hypothetical protein
VLQDEHRSGYCFTYHYRLGSLFSHLDLYPALRPLLGSGREDFVRRLFCKEPQEAFWFAWSCCNYDHEDVACLRFTLDMVPAGKLDYLAGVASNCHSDTCSGNCLQMLLERGAHVPPSRLDSVCEHNRLDVLELVLLQHDIGWCGRVPSQGACLCRTRFLMRIFAAGCPVWTSARDGEPCNTLLGAGTGFVPLGKEEKEVLEDWSLVVSSDLVRSGPVLLLAAQKGAPLTPRMEGMLGEVRRRALALAASTVPPASAGLHASGMPWGACI